MRPTPIFDELTARHRDERGRAGARRVDEAATVLSFPGHDVPGHRPADEPRPAGPRHALRR